MHLWGGLWAQNHSIKLSSRLKKILDFKTGFDSGLNVDLLHPSNTHSRTKDKRLTNHQRRTKDNRRPIDGHLTTDKRLTEDKRLTTDRRRPIDESSTLTSCCPRPQKVKRARKTDSNLSSSLRSISGQSSNKVETFPDIFSLKYSWRNMLYIRTDVLMLEWSKS
jgi:hypothetical protein